MKIDDLKAQFAVTQDEAVLVVLRDALAEAVPEGVADSKRWVAEQIAIVQVRWHSLTSLKETARRHTRTLGACSDFVLARVKRSQKNMDVFAGDVVLVAPSASVDVRRRYFRKYSIREGNAEDFELLNAEVAQDLPPPQQPMLIELKKFVANQRFSEETLMFHAEVWINGKRAGTVGNEGHGGPNSASFTDRTMDQRVQEWLHAQVPDIGTLDSEGQPVSETGRVPSAYELDEDCFFGMLAERALKAKDEKRIERKLQKDAEKMRAAGLTPWKFSLRTKRGDEAFVVCGLKAGQSSESVGARLATKHKSTLLGAEVVP